MSIDLTSETVINLDQAARRLPPGRNGRPVHISTLVRAITRGDRHGHKLEALRIFSRWVTSAEALQRWAERQTFGAEVLPTTRPLAIRRRAGERVDRELKRRGV
jgi:hypothetical protein